MFEFVKHLPFSILACPNRTLFCQSSRTLAVTCTTGRYFFFPAEVISWVLVRLLSSSCVVPFRKVSSPVDSDLLSSLGNSMASRSEEGKTGDNADGPHSLHPPAPHDQAQREWVRAWRAFLFSHWSIFLMSSVPLILAMLLSFCHSLLFPTDTRNRSPAGEEERRDEWRKLWLFWDGDTNSFWSYLLCAFCSFLLPVHHTHTHTKTDTHIWELSGRSSQFISSSRILVPNNNIFCVL